MVITGMLTKTAAMMFWFNREVRDSSIVSFMNLIQADGYNPLIVQGAHFIIIDEGTIKGLFHEFGIVQGAQKLESVLKKGFMPGDLLNLVTREIKNQGTGRRIFNKGPGIMRQVESAEHGEGFWSDHWTYNLDFDRELFKPLSRKFKGTFLGEEGIPFLSQ